jgi:hypothetical protein
MMRSTLAFVLLTIGSAAACIPQSPLERSPCPCPAAQGYICCPKTNRCERQATVDTCTEVPAPGSDAGSDTRVVVSTFESVGIGAAHACAVRRDGTIKCVGSNDKGQATPPPGLFREVVAGEAHTCGVKMVLDDRAQDGTVVCWGDNTYRQLTVPAGQFFGVLTAGGRHTCATWADKVACWGDNSFGQSTPPAGLSAVVDLKAGRNHTCALTRPDPNSGVHVVCWGDNSRGQSTPPADATNVNFLAAGGDHTCASDFGNYLACWGDNDAGQSKEPVGFIRSLSIASGHSCGMPFDGSERVQCWGTDWGTALSTPPTGKFIQVFAGDYLNCAKPSDDKSPLLCWGQTYEPWY